MASIPLTQGFQSIVDKKTLKKYGHLKWTASKKHKTVYAIRMASRKGAADKRSHPIYLHHLVIGKPPSGLEVHHKDGDGLNNKRHNLEFVTHRENLQKTRKHHAGLLPGAYLKKGYKSRPYESTVMINGKARWLGMFATAKEANTAYLTAIKEIPPAKRS